MTVFSMQQCSSTCISSKYKGREYIFALAIDAVQREWISLSTNTDNYFTSYNYLRSLEICPPKDTDFLYVIVKQDGELLAGFYFQYKEFLLQDLINEENAKSNVVGIVRKGISKMMKFNVLVHGNMTLTGYNGSIIASDVWKDDQFHDVYTQSISYLKEEGIPISAILIKDFSLDDFPRLPSYYNMFSVDPNLVLEKVYRWNTIEDYIDDIKSKYKKRYRSARKKMAHIERKDLGVTELNYLQLDTKSLYDNVRNSVSYNLFELPTDYFLKMKEQHQDRFICTGYFLDEKLIAFHTAFRNGSEFDAHYLGLDQTQNREYALYQNMLYDHLENTINSRSERLILSRTATEIKSTLGATPLDTHLFFRVLNPILNPLFGCILGMFYSSDEYVIRSPFK